MILADANLLLYAYNASAPEHERARTWLEECLSRPEPFALSWETISAFLRLATNPRVFPHPYAIGEALRIVDSWLARPMVRVAAPGPRFLPIARALLTEANARGALVPDALLAALAIEQGFTLATHDLDYRRFPSVDSVDPLCQ
ncbi:MAG: PIN domain-containing protein [Thermoanaerobaculia bacterium]|nr:PIN domain-containing protein [Thermoanaerobaculia bacterium]MCZ7650124.1 PIN domain-containing protein [Thermoanaerobaculia bacterium]